MKLRFNGNSIRLRLSKSDIDNIINQEDIVESVSFDKTGNYVFNYVLKLSSSEPSINAYLSPNQITVSIPAEEGLQWAKGNKVGLYHQLPLANGELSVIIEKDYQCLHKRLGEDESDNFPNPKSPI